MVTYDKILKFIDEQSLFYKVLDGDVRQTITVFSNDELLSVDLSFSEHFLTEVYFLNNQYYELSEDILYQCFQDIVYGRYKVRKSIISNKKWLILSTYNTVPTRTIDKNFDFNTYRLLPKTFTPN